MQTQQLKVPPVVPGHERMVKGVYAAMSLLLKRCGVGELTEGRYEDEPGRPYRVAQELQQKHLLDLAGLKAREKMLDIGCGHGVLLRAARGKGIIGTGITISPDQMKFHNGLDTHLLNWRDIPEKKPEWQEQFNGVMAIGSLEHFVSPQEAAVGKKREIYQAFFEVCQWLLKPGGKLVVTAIHYLPDLILQPKMARNQFSKPWRWYTPEFHLGSVAWLGGAYYPIVGELDPIAKQCDFFINHEEDGTKDYHYTSEVWLKSLSGALLRLKLFGGLIKEFKKYPTSTLYGFICFFLFQSWHWQFRDRPGQGPPTRLIRYAWKRG